MRWIGWVLAFGLTTGLTAETSDHDRVATATKADHRWQVSGNWVVTPYQAPAWMNSGTVAGRYEFAETWSLWAGTGTVGVTADGQQWDWSLEPWSWGLGLRGPGPPRWQVGLGGSLDDGKSPAKVSGQLGLSVASDPVVVGWSTAVARIWTADPEVPWMVRTSLSLREVLNDRVSLAVETGWAGVVQDGAVAASLQISWTWSWQEESWGASSSWATGTGSPWCWGGSVDFEGAWGLR